MNNNTIKYKNTNYDFVPLIPENWELRKIKFASSLQSGFAFKSSEYSEEGYPVFRIGDILDEININNCPKNFCSPIFYLKINSLSCFKK